jgi:hypothetical protein
MMMNLNGDLTLSKLGFGHIKQHFGFRQDEENIVYNSSYTYRISPSAGTLLVY